MIPMGYDYTAMITWLVRTTFTLLSAVPQKAVKLTPGSNIDKPTCWSKEISNFIHCGLVKPCGDIKLVSIESSNGLVPGGTKSLALTVKSPIQLTRLLSYCNEKKIQYNTHPEFWPSHRQIFKMSLYYKTRCQLQALTTYSSSHSLLVA